MSFPVQMEEKANHSLQGMKELKLLWDEKESPRTNALKATGKRAKVAPSKVTEQR